MAVAFFDLDKTLLSVNSATLWVRYELRHKQLKVSQALKAMGWLIRYRLGDADLDAPIRYSISTLKGQDPAILAARTRAFYQSEIRQRYRPGGLAVLDQHRRRGDRIVLLTSTTVFLADAVAEDIHFDAVLCTRFETDANGLFTGRPTEPLCFGAGKLLQAQKLLEQWNIPLRECAFYSDSNADMPMFAAVGHPVAINPDPQLMRHAKRLGWPRYDWGRPPKRRASATGDAQGHPAQPQAAAAAPAPVPHRVARAGDLSS